MKKTIATTLTPANVAQVLALLAAAPTKLVRVGQTRSPAQLNQPFGPNQRTYTQVLAHLLHCEAGCVEGIYLALLAEAPEFVPLHPERQLGQLLRYDQWPYADLLAYFQFRRVVLLRVLTALTSAQWARAVRPTTKQRQESVYWLARGQALHEHEHLLDLGSD